ncbi:Uncharacterised protein [Mycobacteroides abscessus subsp. bolletii]|nr:Uncharacterised protein [Mycobacteroides abscessus subsp. bolletii]
MTDRDIKLRNRGACDMTIVPRASLAEAAFATAVVL